MRGCDRTVRLGNTGGGMAGKYDGEQRERGVSRWRHRSDLAGTARQPYIPAPNGQVAQLVEQRTENPRVGGSIPSLAIELSPPRHPKLYLNCTLPIMARDPQALMSCWRRARSSTGLAGYILWWSQ